MTAVPILAHRFREVDIELVRRADFPLIMTLDDVEAIGIIRGKPMAPHTYSSPTYS